MGSVENGRQAEDKETHTPVLGPKELESGLSSGDADASGNENGGTGDLSLIVDWDGPDDPANPHNWSAKQKAVTIGIVSVITFITYVP